LTNETPDQNYLPGAEPLFIKGSNLGCLLLHGAGGGTAWDLKEMSEYLHRQLHATVWLPSLTGFGTEPEDLYTVTFDKWMNDAQEGLERLQCCCDKIIVLGHSFGGLLGLLLAANNDSISVLITWAGVYGIKDRRLALLPYISKIPLLRRLIPDKFPMNPSQSLIKKGWIGYTWLPVSIVTSFTEGLKRLQKSISKVSCPTLIVQGTLDESVTADSPRTIYKSISSSIKDIWIAEGGHHPIMQDEHLKDELFKRTVQFIQTVLELPKD
jgi:carboxylesterase